MRWSLNLLVISEILRSSRTLKLFIFSYTKTKWILISENSVVTSLVYLITLKVHVQNSDSSSFITLIIYLPKNILKVNLHRLSLSENTFLRIPKSNRKTLINSSTQLSSLVLTLLTKNRKIILFYLIFNKNSFNKCKRKSETKN